MSLISFEIKSATKTIHDGDGLFPLGQQEERRQVLAFRLHLGRQVPRNGIGADRQRHAEIARTKVIEARSLIAKNIDPIAARQAERQARAISE
jgi:hypothetical protein